MASPEQKTTKKRRSSAQGKFHKIYGALNRRCNPEDLDVVNSMLHDLEQAYGDLESKHAEYVETLNEEDDDEIKMIEEMKSAMAKTYDEVCTARTNVATKRKDVVKNEPVKKSVKQDIHITVKKLEAPTFSGNVHHYPT